MNLDRKVKLGTNAIDTEDKDLSTLLSCFKGFAQNFSCHALSQKIETEAGMQHMFTANLPDKIVPKYLAETIAQKSTRENYVIFYW